MSHSASIANSSGKKADDLRPWRIWNILALCGCVLALSFMVMYSVELDAEQFAREVGVIRAFGAFVSGLIVAFGLNAGSMVFRNLMR